MVKVFSAPFRRIVPCTWLELCLRASAATTSALTAPTPSAAMIPAWTSPASMERWSNRTSNKFTGPGGVAVDPPGGSPDCLMRAGRRTRLPRPGQSGGPGSAGQRARFGLEDLQKVIRPDGMSALGNNPLMSDSHGTAVEHHVFGCPQRHP